MSEVRSGIDRLPLVWIEVDVRDPANLFTSFEGRDESSAAPSRGGARRRQGARGEPPGERAGVHGHDPV